jgi:hypothetical protein
MGGWKTKTAAAGTILMGLGTILTEAITLVSGEGGDIDTVKAGFLMITAGLGMLGIGHKIEKLK